MVISCISYTMCYINMCSASALGYRCLPEVSGKKYRRSAWSQRTCVCIYIYIYVNRERERDYIGKLSNVKEQQARWRESPAKNKQNVHHWSPRRRLQSREETPREQGVTRKGGWNAWKPSSSSNLSIRVVRVYPPIEIRQENGAIPFALLSLTRRLASPRSRLSYEHTLFVNRESISHRLYIMNIYVMY